MSSKPIILIIGRPNVGKSSLFNRIIGKRFAVVDDLPGVTRDRNYYDTIWNGEEITLVDTGGLTPNIHDGLPEAIREQVQIALSESDAVIFLVDATTGPTDLDVLIAKLIRQAAANKVVCCANKSESPSSQYEISAFRTLGLGPVFSISAIHGSGVADVLDRAITIIQQKRGPSDPRSLVAHDMPLKLALVGRPNAGKSSLVNCLLHKHRMIVDAEPGTTRDSIDSETVYQGKKVVLIDTAGLRKKSHVKQDMEYYANLRAIESIERCNICVLVVDVTTGVGVQDLRILQKILEMRKGVMLAWNKWDIMQKDHATFDHLVALTRKTYKELTFVPMIALSALTGQRATTVFEVAFKIKERLEQRVGNTDFENNLFSWVRAHPHPAIPHNPIRFVGAKQIVAPFPLFQFFISNPSELAPAYHRYLINKIYEQYDFEGCPVVLKYKPIAKPKHGCRSPSAVQDGPAHFD